MEKKEPFTWEMDPKQALQYLFGNKCFILQIGEMKSREVRWVSQGFMMQKLIWV